MSKKPLRPRNTVAGFTDSGLPTRDQVDHVAEQITPTTTPTAKAAITAADLRPPADRAPGLTQKGRVKFTTMLKPDLRLQLETIAQNRTSSVADILEIIIAEYLDALRAK